MSSSRQRELNRLRVDRFNRIRQGLLLVNEENSNFRDDQNIIEDSANHVAVSES